MTVHFAMSPAKADRLYWLGRYTERVSIVLHLLRKYYDEIINDGSCDAHAKFCAKMGIPCIYPDANSFITQYLYDSSNEYSVINMLERVKDNAILLREEIKSETLSYIEMSINHMKACEAEGRGLYDLQFITDSIFAFWGALDEILFNRTVRAMINKGRYVEKVDLFIRFGYDKARIKEIFDRLQIIERNENEHCDTDELDALCDKIDQLEVDSMGTLSKINQLFAA